MSFFLYILKCKGGYFYTGIAKDVQKRFKQHRLGRGARYTKYNKPLSVLYVEAHPDRGSATKREAEIKKWPKAKKVMLVKSKAKVKTRQK